MDTGMDTSMAAIADRDLEGRSLAQALQRFGRALAGWEPSPGAIEDALRAARWAPCAMAARVEGYRSLIRHYSASGRAARAPQAFWSATPPANRRGSDSVPTLRALTGLEPAHRAALLLVAVERLPYDRAAEALEMTAPEFVHALARAREALAARLAATAAGRPRLRLVS